MSKDKDTTVYRPAVTAWLAAAKFRPTEVKPMHESVRMEPVQMGTPIKDCLHEVVVASLVFHCVMLTCTCLHCTQ